MGIASSVGRSGTNDFSDGKVVQALLNLNRSRIPEQQRPDRLPINGMVGPLTIAFIRAFQSEVMGMGRTLGVVVEGDATMRELAAGVPPGLSREKLAAIMPFAQSANLDRYHMPLKDSMAARGVDTPLRMAHLLAQVGHESGSLRFSVELASGQAYEGRLDLGNTEPGDGPRFKGRGLIQLTGRTNYTHYGEATGIDYVGDPERLGSDPVAAADVAAWFWETHNLSALADQDDVTLITRAVNGGFNGLNERAAFLRRARVLLGVHGV